MVIFMKMLGLYEIRRKKGYSQLKIAMDLNITRKLAAFDVSAPVRKWGVLWNSIVRKTGECIDHIFHPFG